MENSLKEEKMIEMWYKTEKLLLIITNTVANFKLLVFYMVKVSPCLHPTPVIQVQMPLISTTFILLKIAWKERK